MERLGSGWLKPDQSEPSERGAAIAKRETIVKRPRWLRWSRREEHADSKAENLKEVRRRTDQKIKQQDAQQKRQDEKK